MTFALDAEALQTSRDPSEGYEPWSKWNETMPDSEVRPGGSLQVASGPFGGFFGAAEQVIYTNAALGKLFGLGPCEVCLLSRKSTPMPLNRNPY